MRNKNLLALLGLVLLGGALAQSDAYTNVDPSGQTVTFWHQLTGNNEKVLQQIIADFNKTNKYGVTVKPQYQGSYADIYQKMVPILGTPAMPDLVVAYQNQAASYQLAGALLDLNPLVDSAKWGLSDSTKKDFFPGIYKADVFPVFGGQRLGFPVQRSLEAMYYNSDWLKQLGFSAPPTTPTQFQKMACLASKQPFAGAKAKNSVGYELSLDASRFASWTYAYGGDIYDAKANKYTLNDPAAIKAMSFLQSLFKQGCAKVVTENYGDQTDFGAGQLLFAVGSTSGLPFYRSAVNDGAKFNWSVAALPHTTTRPVQNIYGASVSLPDTGDKKRELAAWLFVKFWSTPEVQSQWAQGSNYFPTRRSVAAKLGDYFAKNPAYKTGFGLLNYTTAEPAVPGYDAVRTLIEKRMAAMMQGADVKSNLDALNVEANKQLADQLAQLKKR